MNFSWKWAPLKYALCGKTKKRVAGSKYGETQSQLRILARRPELLHPFQITGFKCKYCPAEKKDFRNRHSLHNHIYKFHQGIHIPYTNSNLHKEGLRKFRCEFEGCNGSYKSERSRDMHYNTIHGIMKSDPRIKRPRVLGSICKPKKISSYEWPTTRKWRNWRGQKSNIIGVKPLLQIMSAKVLIANAQKYCTCAIHAGQLFHITKKKENSNVNSKTVMEVVRLNGVESFITITYSKGPNNSAVLNKSVGLNILRN